MRSRERERDKSRERRWAKPKKGSKEKGSEAVLKEECNYVYWIGPRHSRDYI